MQNHEVTIMALLSLKKRRESGIRAQLVQLEKQQSEQLQARERLMLQRKTLCEQWKDYSSHERLLAANKVSAYRNELASYYQQDQSIIEKINITKNKHSELKIKKENQLGLLQRIILEQEKLKLLLE